MILSLTLAILLPAGAVFAQAIEVPDTTGAADTTVAVDSTYELSGIDTLLFRPKIEVNAFNTVTNPTNFEEHMTQQPTIALLKSAVVPGWGQLGNRRYVKAGLFAALQVWFVSAALHYGADAADYREEWNNATDPTARNEWYGLYQDHRDDRNKYTWFAVINGFVAMFDAYVDAHLSGSPEKQRQRSLSFDIMPQDFDGTRAVLTYSF